MIIKRDYHLRQLSSAKHNGAIKIVTGLRRCGKSYLLRKLFKQHLLDEGVLADHILEIDLEQVKDTRLLDPKFLGEAIESRIKHDRKWTYVLIDEIQLCKKIPFEGIDVTKLPPDEAKNAFFTFHRTLSRLQQLSKVDVYVTGSNSKMLSSDIATEFRGRGDVIQLSPLSMSEFFPLRKSARDLYAVFYEYLDFGGLPGCVLSKTPDEKMRYLTNLYKAIYLRDIAERNGLKNDILLDALTATAMSNIGCPTNPAKLANSVQTVMGIKTNRVTVSKYLDFLVNAFVLAKAQRFDVKGNHYLDTPLKYYAGDCGLRNASLGFRQNERPHLMENAIYNELISRGYSVDVGEIANNVFANGKHEVRRHEIDFVVNKASERIYIQSAFSIPDEEKRSQETFSLTHTRDHFRKIVVTGDPYEKPWMNKEGITFIGIMPFLLDPKSIETL